MGDLILGKQFQFLDTGASASWTAQLPKVFYWSTVLDLFQGTGLPSLLRLFLRYSRMLSGTAKTGKDFIGVIIGQVRSTKFNSQPAPSVMSEFAESNENGARMNDYKVARHLADITLGGIDTTYTALISTLYFVLQNSEAHKSLVNEIRACFRSEADVFAYNDWNSLPYLNAVIQESLRCYPPIPIGLPRLCPGAEVDGMFIPKGFQVSTPLLAIQHKPENFAEPFTFRPGRWIEHQMKDNLPASRPFGLGSRVCIGMNLAWMLLRVTLASFLLRYDAELTGKIIDLQAETKNFITWQVPELVVNLNRATAREA